MADTSRSLAKVVGGWLRGLTDRSLRSSDAATSARLRLLRLLRRPRLARREDMAKAPNPFAGDADYLGPISATPQKMVETMLELAGVGPGDVVYDLGCNDGRVCITAARDRGARGVGVEIDRGAVDKARRLADEAGVASLVDIRLGNAVAEPLTDATVTFVYLLPKGNAKVSRKLMRELKPGTLVMTYVFRLPADHWDAHLERVEAIKSTRDRVSGGVDASAYNKIYAYRVPEFKPAWCEESPEDGDNRGDWDAGGAGETPG